MWLDLNFWCAVQNSRNAVHCYIAETQVQAPGCPEKGKTTLGGPYRQYDSFLIYLNDYLLGFDIAFSRERAASIFMVT